MKNVDIVSKVVARQGEALSSPSKYASTVNLSDYLLKSIWDKVFELRTDSVGSEYIFGKLPMVTQYGITMYSGDGVKVPSLASGLPFDGRTIWYNPDTQQIEVIGGTGGESGEGVSNFWDLSGIPLWITNSKPKYTYSEIDGTPNLSVYATQSWVVSQGYLTEHQDLSGYQTKITSSNKLAYSLISGTPTSLKNPTSLKFGSKSYDGSSEQTILANDLGALTSHQTIYALKFQSGTFSAGSFTANSAAKTINIPTTTSHISEGTNLYFTNARAVSALADTLKAYVTLAGTQTITGEKNFTGGFKVNGSPIVYDATKKYWKLEGDLLVTGGVTMYGSDSSFTPSTITDAVNIDNVTIKRNSQGQLYAVGGGAADSVAWDNIDGKPTFATVATSGKYSDLSGTPTSLKNPTSLTFGSKSYDGSAARTITASDLGALTSHQDISHLLSKTDASSTYQTKITSSNKLAYSLISGTPSLASVATSGKYDDLSGKPTLLSSFTDDIVSGKYLPLSGGTISGTYGALVIHRTNDKSSLIKYSNTSGDLGHLGFNSSKEPFVYKGTDTTTQYKIWHTGNDGEGSGLDADLLDGVQLNELFSSLSSNSTNKVSITIGGVTKNITTLYASYTNNFRVVWNNPTSGTYELNDLVGGFVRHYGSGGSLSNAPSSFGNGAVLALSNGTKGLSGQLAWNIVHNSTSNVTNKLWWRAADSTNGFTYSQWKQIAFTDSNVASATKIETARTIWGQSFDGSGNVSGNMTGVGTISMSSALTLTGTSSTTARIIMSRSSSNYINYPTDGILCFGTSNSTTSVQMLIDGATGNVGIGTTAPDYRFHVSQNTDNTWASVFQTPNSKVYLAQSSGRGIYAGVLSGVSTSYLLHLQYNQTTLGSGGSSALYVRTDGNIGIGTENPDYKFHVVGTSHINGEASFNSSVTLKGTDSSTARIIMSRSSYNYINYPTNGKLCLGTSNNTASTQLCINGSNGYVGVGTTSPSAKLHVGGDILATGGFTMYSQRSLKNIQDERGLSLNELSIIKPTRYTWKDGRDNKLHIGGIADDVMKVLPEVVYKTSDGTLTMDYGNAAFAVASSLINPVMNHEERISLLEEENKQLRAEVERLKSA